MNNDFRNSASAAERSPAVLDNPLFEHKGVSEKHKSKIPVKLFRRNIISFLKFIDILALFSAGLFGYLVRFSDISGMSAEECLLIYFSIMAMVVLLHVTGAYRVDCLASINCQFSALFAAGAGTLLLVLLCGFLSGTTRNYSRIWVVVSVLFATSSLIANRILLIQLIKYIAKYEQMAEISVIVGANEHAERMVSAFQNKHYSTVNILGIFDDRVEDRIPISLHPKMLGSTEELINYVRNNRVDNIFVALPWIESPRINAILGKLSTVPTKINLVPNDLVWKFSKSKMDRIEGIPLITIANNRIDEQIGMAKRLEDVLLSSAVLLLISPLLILIAMAIKIDSPGPAIFKQRRHGYNNQIFEVYKFRSMKIEEDVAELRQATRNDPRVTRVGKILRRFSLDELPQLINVLQGKMSIVGPRPHAVQHNLLYGSIIQEYFARHNVKPGITGWAQVNGLRGETNTPEKMRLRVNADLYYIENWSLFFDLKIILMTAATVWFHREAY